MEATRGTQNMWNLQHSNESLEHHTAQQQYQLQQQKHDASAAGSKDACAKMEAAVYTSQAAANSCIADAYTSQAAGNMRTSKAAVSRDLYNQAPASSYAYSDIDANRDSYTSQAAMNKDVYSKQDGFIRYGASSSYCQDTIKRDHLGGSPIPIGEDLLLFIVDLNT